ncbi:hypothetical protein ACRRTK_017902 [Alexandromys fortis]
MTAYNCSPIYYSLSFMFTVPSDYITGLCSLRLPFLCVFNLGLHYLAAIAFHFSFPTKTSSFFKEISHI